MTKINKTSFKKGNLANPKGRPKGTVSEYKKKFMEIQKLAANDACAVYNEIREKMLMGESWAYQLYVKDFIPKRAFQPTILVKIEKGKNRGDSVIEALPQFVELTHDEAMDEIRTFKGIEQQDECKEERKGTVEEMTRLVKESWSKTS
jgi:hypothetical protein